MNELIILAVVKLVIILPYCFSFHTVSISTAQVSAESAMTSAFVNQSPPSSLTVLVTAAQGGLPPHLLLANAHGMSAHTYT